MASKDNFIQSKFRKSELIFFKNVLTDIKDMHSYGDTEYKAYLRKVIKRIDKNLKTINYEYL